MIGFRFKVGRNGVYQVGIVIYDSRPKGIIDCVRLMMICMT